MTENPKVLLIFALILFGGTALFMKYREKQDAIRAAAGAPAKSPDEQLQDDMNTLVRAVKTYYREDWDRAKALLSRSNEDIFRELNLGSCRHCNAYGEWLDTWNNPLRFAIDSQGTDRTGIGYGVYSWGPNGLDENRLGDDIVAWQEVMVIPK